MSWWFSGWWFSGWWLVGILGSLYGIAGYPWGTRPTAPLGAREKRHLLRCLLFVEPWIAPENWCPDGQSWTIAALIPSWCLGERRGLFGKKDSGRFFTGFARFYVHFKKRGLLYITHWKLLFYAFLMMVSSITFFDSWPEVLWKKLGVNFTIWLNLQVVRVPVSWP